MKDFNQIAFKQVLKKMFDPTSHFSICDFDAMIEIAGITVSRPEYNALRVFHCVSYRDMTRETKDALIAKIGEILERGACPVFKLREALEQTETLRPTIQIQAGWFQKLLGR